MHQLSLDVLTYVIWIGGGLLALIFVNFVRVRSVRGKRMDRSAKDFTQQRD